MEVEGEDLVNVLKELLSDGNVTFEIKNKKIYFILKELVDVESAKSWKITGVVKDVNGEPIIGANILVKGSTIGVISDIDGKFLLNEVPAGSILEISYIGYDNREIKLKDEAPLTVILTENSTLLEELVVIGYGSVRKRDLTGAVSQINADQIQKGPVTNILQSVQGRISGFHVTPSSGQPGASTDVLIHGTQSINGTNAPIYVIDGTISENINNLNPQDIETFTVLKDASAVAIYGSRAGNGVILITSKRGNSQKPKISFRAEGTILEPTRLPTFMNSVETLNLYNEALNNEGTASIRTDEEIAKYGPGADRDLYPDTDWLGTMLRNHTYNMRYTLNVRGGTERARYFVSGAFYQENGIFKDFGNDYDNNIGLKRYNLRSNIDFDATKTTTVKVDLSGQYLQTNYPGTGTSTIFTTMCRTPSYIMPAVYSDGTIAGHPRPSGNRSNPYNLLVNSGYAKEWRTSIQSKVEIDQKLDFLTKGLTWKGLISFDADMSYIAKRTKTPTQYLATGRDENGSLLYKTVVEGSDVLSENLFRNGYQLQPYFCRKT